MNTNDMTTEQIKACLTVHDATKASFRETAAKLREAGVDEGYIHVLDMPAQSYEWAEELREELEKREKLEGVMDAIYKNQFPNPRDRNIRPLTECPKWEQDMIRSQAEAVLTFLKGPEPLAQWEIELLESGKD
ncbi:hypothetical protein SEA_ATUIN_260 [Arthrobacter phage Atuin]|nr:hypothetical protein SEA_ATUIN_59 [Arthrobacter phage Atuin]